MKMYENFNMIKYHIKIITQEINKAIHYYSLSSNQNYSDAYNLGVIYLKEEYNGIILKCSW